MKQVRDVGLEYYDVLWGWSTKSVLQSFIQNGFKAIVTSVWLKKLDRNYLGGEINKEFLLDIEKEKNVDVCGENGEYHSLIYAGPYFRQPLSYKIYGIHEEIDNIFLDIRKH